MKNTITIDTTSMAKLLKVVEDPNGVLYFKVGKLGVFPTSPLNYAMTLNANLKLPDNLSLYPVFFGLSRVFTFGRQN